jgi:hypothetical protein
VTEPPRNPAVTAPRAAGEDRNIVDLVGRLTQQGAHLAREQVSLMQAEVREGVQEIKSVIGAMLGAAVLGIAGFGVLLMGLGYWLGTALENLALGTIIVGVATLVVAAILYATGRSAVGNASLKPDRTIDTIADTPAAVTGELHHSGGHNAR